MSEPPLAAVSLLRELGAAGVDDVVTAVLR
jgi:hypothetical protein